MSRTPSTFRSKGHGDDRQVFPLFDTMQNVGKPLRSSKSMSSSREYVHQIRAAKYNREMQERDYAHFVEGSYHGEENIVAVRTPSHTTNLKLTTVNIDDIDVKNKTSPHFEESSVYYQDAIKRGQTIEPILIHKLPDGRIELLDGNARVDAYRKMGIKEVPAVENSLGDVLGKIGHGLKAAFTGTGHAVATGIRHPNRVHIRRLPEEGEKESEKYIPPPPSRMRVLGPLHKAESVVGKAQSKVKGFQTGVIGEARWRTLRHQVQSPNAKVRNKAMRTVASKFPEHLAEAQALESHREK